MPLVPVAVVLHLRYNLPIIIRFLKAGLLDLDLKSQPFLLMMLIKSAGNNVFVQFQIPNIDECQIITLNYKN